MSSGVELATAYISLVPSLKGATQTITEQLAPAAAEAGGRAGESSGNRLTAGFGSAMAKVGGIAMGAVTAVGGVIGGIALHGGIDRALNIENAQAKLLGLGNSTETVQTIMGNALASVKGTAFGLGDAATVAASAVAAGIKPGDELQGVLSTVADTATIAGASMSDMGLIFGSVAARGKLQGDDLMQLQSRGVPVLAFLAKHYGITAAQASDMVSKGQVDFKNFNAAMQENMGGAAKKSGDTFTGAMANVRAALGRLGAGVATPFLQAATKIAPSVISLIDKVSTLATPVITKMAGAVSAAVPQITGLIDKITGKLGGAHFDFSAFAGLGPILAGLSGFAVSFLSKIPLIGGAFAGITGPIGILITSFATLMATSPQLREALGSSLGQIAAVLGPALQQIAGAIMPAFNSMLSQLAPVLVMVAQALGPLVSELITALVPIIMQLISAVMPPLLQVFAAVVPVVEQIIAVLVPLASFIIAQLVPVIQALMPVVTSVFNIIASVIIAAMQIVRGVIDVVMGIIRGNWSQVWSGILQIFAGIWNTILALVGGVLGALGGAIGGAMNWIGGMVGGALGWVGGLFAGAWNGIISGAGGMVGGLMGWIGSIPGRVMGALGGLGSLLWNSGQALIQGFIDGIKSMLGSIGNAVSSVLDFAKQFFPHSPAKRGPFSGTGYTSFSGRKLAEDFAGGIMAGTDSVTLASHSLLKAVTVPKAASMAVDLAGGSAGAGAAGGGTEIHVHESSNPYATAVNIARLQQAALG